MVKQKASAEQDEKMMKNKITKQASDLAGHVNVSTLISVARVQMHTNKSRIRLDGSRNCKTK